MSNDLRADTGVVKRYRTGIAELDIVPGPAAEASGEARREPASHPPPDRRNVWMKSYQYLRTAMVALLVGLAVAVFLQGWHQGFHLASVSAYYYTPAQAIFVGVLIGVGACMIALQGADLAEEVFLNLGGMFAAVVAIIPTSRGEDYETAVRACEEAAGPLLTEKASTGLDCPTVMTLAAATRANVENNMIALLVVGALGLVAAVLFRLRDKCGRWARFWWGFVPASVVWAVAVAAYFISIESLVRYGHYIAAAGLLTCIVVVAVANALRHEDSGSGRTRNDLMAAVGTLIPGHTGGVDRYAGLAWLMVAATAIGVPLVFYHAFTLFWLEIVVALLFAVFWMVQTLERQSPPTSLGRATTRPTAEYE